LPARLLQIDNALHFFGESGFAAFASAADTPENAAALDLLAARLKDPQFSRPIYPRDRTELVK
jgi:hypothetical protein